MGETIYFIVLEDFIFHNMQDISDSAKMFQLILFLDIIFFSFILKIYFKYEIDLNNYYLIITYLVLYQPNNI